MDIPKKKIFYSVLIIHLVILGMFTRNYSSPPNPPSEIHVKTYVQKEKKIVPKKKQLTASTQATVKKRRPAPKKKKKTANRINANTQKKTAKVSHSLLQELRQNLDSISSVEQKYEKKEIIVPKKILDLQIDQPVQTEESADEVPYETLLGEVLKSGLTLPDYGEVKARITLHPNGSLVQLEILESKSHQNESYLKNRLQEIAFPCFNSATTEKKVVVTFKNQ